MQTAFELIKKCGFRNVTLDSDVSFSYINIENIEFKLCLRKVDGIYKIFVKNLKDVKRKPICHISSNGVFCLDGNANRFGLDESPTEVHLNNLKDILNYENELDDSFADFILNAQNRNSLFEISHLKKVISEIHETKEVTQTGPIYLSDSRYSTLPQWIRDEVKMFKKICLIIKNEKFKHKVKMFFDGWGGVYPVVDFTPENLIMKTGAKINDDLYIVFGVGSLGSEVVEQLYLSGTKNLILVDYDVWSEMNSYRWNGFKSTVGTKVKVVESYYQIFYGKEVISLMDIKINDSHNFDNQTQSILDYLPHYNSKKIHIINTTANDVSILQMKKLFNILKTNNPELEIDLTILFLEENGLFAHAINKINEGHFGELDTFMEEYDKGHIQMMKKSDEFIFNAGCANETQVYSQNSSKYFAMYWNLVIRNGVVGITSMRHEMADFSKISSDKFTERGLKCLGRK